MDILNDLEAVVILELRTQPGSHCHDSCTYQPFGHGDRTIIT